MALIFFMKKAVSVRNLSFRPLLALSGVLAVILCALICFGSTYVVGLRDAQVAAADSLKPSTSHQSNAGGQAGSNAAQNASRTLGAAANVTEPVETCVPSTGALTPSAMPLSDSTNGLNQQIDQPNQYQIFGRNSATLRDQIRQCSPHDAGQNAQFAAQTTYNLTWRYQYVGIGNDMCQVTNASVGIHISQIMPLWHPDSSTPASLTSGWNNFAKNLTTHESGHVSLDLQYAQALLNDLRSFPPTPCSQMAESVKHLADSDSAMLSQANDNYDTTSNHGATQGAILP
jgi:predicted secreted Zn-dependent protease